MPKHHEIIITREQDQNVQLVFCCQSRESLSEDEVMERVVRAVTDWMYSTEAGKSAWRESGEDFNIGDLSMCLTSLVVWFSEVGLYDVVIRNPTTTVCPAWVYDTVLVNREELTRFKPGTMGAANGGNNKFRPFPRDFTVAQLIQLVQSRRAFKAFLKEHEHVKAK